MSTMRTESTTIYNILKDINENKLVMPAFQRNYVWDLERIEKLWDSILQGYPFSTFLFWELDANHVSSGNFFYIFARTCTFKSAGENDGCEYQSDTINFNNPNHPNIAVLDGQQRLTSLFLSLYGEVYKRGKNQKRSSNTKYIMRLYIELDKNKIDENEAFNAKKYSVYFTDRLANGSNSRIELKTFLDKDLYEDHEMRNAAIEEIVRNIPANSQDYARDTLNRICSAIYDQQLVTYTKVSELTQDDALEMFVRFNSGGKNLTKAQISMSILEAYWPNSKIEFNRILSGKYAKFDTDFILRTAHMLFGDVVKSNIDSNFARNFQRNLDNFKRALNNTADLFDMMNYDIERFSSKWNILIPIIYLIYNNSSYIDCAQGIFAYLFRAILFLYYASGTTGRLANMRHLIFNNNYILTPQMLDTIPELLVTDARIDDILISEYKSPTAENALYCLGVNNFEDNYDYAEDHIYPRARFERSAPINMSAGDWNTARSLFNKLPNLQSLRSDKNESKGDAEFDNYYLSLNATEKAKMKAEGFIPDPSHGMTEDEYYKIENFLIFYNDRRELLKQKLRLILNGDVH